MIVLFNNYDNYYINNINNIIYIYKYYILNIVNNNIHIFNI